MEAAENAEQIALEIHQRNQQAAEQNHFALVACYPLNNFK